MCKLLSISMIQNYLDVEVFILNRRMEFMYSRLRFQCRIVSMQNCFNLEFFQCKIVQMQNYLNAELFKCKIVSMQNCPNAKSSQCRMVLMYNCFNAILFCQIKVRRSPPVVTIIAEGVGHVIYHVKKNVIL